MITNHDRSGWFGASDASYIVGNIKTVSWRKWWLTKLGLTEQDFTNQAMRAGTAFEHRILDTIPGVRKDHQILLPKLHLRVNYDGDRNGVIYEVKTHQSNKPFKVTAGYWRQAQVELFAMGTRELYLVSYGLTEADYHNYFAEIDLARLRFYKVEYDEDWIENVFLPRLKWLGRYLESGRMPAWEQDRGAERQQTFPRGSRGKSG